MALPPSYQFLFLPRFPIMTPPLLSILKMLYQSTGMTARSYIWNPLQIKFSIYSPCTHCMKWNLQLFLMFATPGFMGFIRFLHNLNFISLVFFHWCKQIHGNRKHYGPAALLVCHFVLGNSNRKPTKDHFYLPRENNLFLLAS